MNRPVVSFLESQGGLLLIMLICLLVFSGITIGVVVCLPSNQGAFQLFSNLVTGFGASLMTAAQIQKNQNQKNQDPPQS